jgi:esterase
MKLFSRILGQGNPLIIVHGLFGMSDNWQTLAKRFSSFFEVHLIDQRNHGRSPHSDGFSYDLMSEDLLEYLQLHQLQEVILLGHSLGGKTAMHFATQNPHFVDKLIVVDIGPKQYPVHHGLIIEGLKSVASNPLKSRSVADQLLSIRIDELGVRQFLLKSLYWNDEKQLVFRFNLDSIAKHIENVGQELHPDWQFSKPTLFIKGGNSNYIKDEDEEGIFHHFPDADLETIPNAGHWLHAEQPDVFYDLVMRFAL